MGAFGDRVRTWVNKLGMDVYRYPMPGDPRHVRQRTLRHLGVDLVLDVGANVGDYAADLRYAGYAGRVVSFEPVAAMYRTLASRAAGDPNWACRKLALGDVDGFAEINVADKMSSFLPKAGDNPAFPIDVAGTERVPVARLDTIRRELFAVGERVWLKMDVQGFEQNVLRGADAALGEVVAVELEMSLHPLYEGQADYRQVSDGLAARGFELWSLHPAGREPTGRLIEMDGTFVRTAAAAATTTAAG
jgi:FkbM family methyltransferase